MMSKLKKLGVILLITGERENELKKKKKSELMQMILVM